MITIDIVPFVLCLIGSTIFGVFLTFATIMLAVLYIDNREMRRVARGLWGNVQQYDWHPYKTPPPAQSRGSTPLPKQPAGLAIPPSAKIREEHEQLVQGRKLQNLGEVRRPAHLDTGEIPVPLAQLPNTNPRFGRVSPQMLGRPATLQRLLGEEKA